MLSTMQRMSWARTLSSALIASLCLAGCSQRKEPAAADWVQVKTTHSGRSVIVQKVAYRSDGLLIRGQICRPKAPGRHRVLVWNHGGIGGIGNLGSLAGVCANMARKGWVFAASSYRGEDGSGGHIEICAGEVNDVLALLHIVRSKPYADPKRVAMVGASHGGCITLRAIVAGAPVQAAVDFAGPTDWAKLWTSLSTGSSSIEPSNSAPTAVEEATTLQRRIATAIGGPPGRARQQYLRRSPIREAGKLTAWRKPILIVHGAADPVVPVTQSCELAQRGGFAAYRVTVPGSAPTSDSSVCSGLTWLPENPATANFPGRHYLLVYDGVDHQPQGALSAELIANYMAFLEAKLPK
jgi:dipeptidyl aminopeptidase/acylaminoacyl peptidase